MRELCLFTGVGGGILASKLMGWNTLGYVEINQYCQEIVAQRIKDGILEEAPIFSDIREFINQGYAKSYQGLVDVLSSGFPCQPFSTAGKRAGGEDHRNMWPETIECIRIIRPRFAFLENVPGLLSHPYGRTIFRDLAKSGYECRWDVFSAAGVGADHIRQRLWIVAYSKYEGLRPSWQGRNIRKKIKSSQPLVEQYLLERATEKDAIAGRSDIPKPLLFRNVDDVARGMERLKAIGNGQVPIVAKKAWETLTGIL